MARTQILKSGTTVVVTTAGTPEPLSATDLWVKSFIVQGNVANSGYVFLGDSTAQLQAIEPGRSVTITGDNMDNGTASKINLADVYLDSEVSGESASFTYLDLI